MTEQAWQPVTEREPLCGRIVEARLPDGGVVALFRVWGPGAEQWRIATPGGPRWTGPVPEAWRPVRGGGA